jgi:hypothetical protein
MAKTPARQSDTPASLAMPELLLSFTTSNLSSSAKQKVTTGMELEVAEATVADVNFRLKLYRFRLNVFLPKTKGRRSIYH